MQDILVDQNIIITEPCKTLRTLGRNALAGKWKTSIIAVCIYVLVMQLPVAVFDALRTHRARDKAAERLRAFAQRHAEPQTGVNGKQRIGDIVQTGHRQDDGSGFALIMNRKLRIISTFGDAVGGQLRFGITAAGAIAQGHAIRQSF